MTYCCNAVAWSLILLAVFFQGEVQAQDLPNAPVPVVNEQGKVVLEPHVPVAAAGDALFAPLATAGPDTLHRRFMSYAVVTFGPRALFTPAVGAAIRQARPNKNYPPEWQRGADAFGRNYGNGVATKTAFQTARFGVGALLHEDVRYRPTWGGVSEGSMRGSAGRGGPARSHLLEMPHSDKNPVERIAYAVGFVFVDRSDSGHLRPAVANFSAAAAAGFVGNAYLPDGFNDASQGARRMGTRFGSMAIQNVLREFSPEIFGVTRHLHIPFPRIPIPEWWVPLDSTQHRHP